MALDELKGSCVCSWVDGPSSLSSEEVRAVPEQLRNHKQSKHYLHATELLVNNGVCERVCVCMRVCM